MKKNIFALLLSFFILGSVSAAVNDKDLIGLWNDDKIVMEGYGDCYQLFADKTFIFNFSQMDRRRRILSYEGVYSLKGSTITFTVKKMTMFLDGRFADRPDPEAPYGPKDGTKVTTELKAPLVMKYNFTITTEQVGMDGTISALNLNKLSFYRVSKNPKLP